jgi:hypothetical protein
MNKLDQAYAYVKTLENAEKDQLKKFNMILLKQLKESKAENSRLVAKVNEYRSELLQVMEILDSWKEIFDMWSIWNFIRGKGFDHECPF